MITNSLNPEVVKTYLDGLFFSEWDLSQHPEIATAEDAYVFNQFTSDKSQETLEEFKGSGAWEARAELQDAPEGQPQAVYAVTFTNAELAKGVTISGRFFDDDQHNMISLVMKDFAAKGIASKNKDAFAVYRNAFSTAMGDGVSLINNSHPITGGTADNYITTKLNESSLNDLIVMLAEMKERDGVQMGRMPQCLLVPTSSYKRAVIITDSELRSATANNDANVYSSRYGIMIKTTPYIGTSAGGSDNYAFLLARNHPVIRYLRQDVKTVMVDRNVSKNDSYFYRGSFRQSVGAASFTGIVGTDGTTGSYDS
jgi:hypothetical protein